MSPKQKDIGRSNLFAADKNFSLSVLSHGERKIVHMHCRAVDAARSNGGIILTDLLYFIIAAAFADDYPIVHSKPPDLNTTSLL